MHTHDVMVAAPLGLHGDGQVRCGNPVAARHRATGSLGRLCPGSLVWALIASVLAASTVAFGEPLPTSYIYGIDDNSQLWEMALSGTTAGTASGTARLVGPSTLTAAAANGLAYDPLREQLFGVDTATSELYWWQQGATSDTSLGSIAAYITGAGSPVSAAYYNDAYWFLGNGETGNVLGKLEVTYTGNVPTAVSGTTFTILDMATTQSSGGDLVILPNGTLYAYSAPNHGNFFTLDVTTAASGTVGGYNLISTNPGTGLQLALGVDNTTLYGQDFATGSWYIVDPSTGTTAEIPGFTTTPVGGSGFRDLGGSSVQAVPEPSCLVLAASGGGILLWQVSRRRRRTPTGSATLPRSQGRLPRFRRMTATA